MGGRNPKLNLLRAGWIPQRWLDLTCCETEKQKSTDIKVTMAKMKELELRPAREVQREEKREARRNLRIANIRKRMRVEAESLGEM